MVEPACVVYCWLLSIIASTLIGSVRVVGIEYFIYLSLY